MNVIQCENSSRPCRGSPELLTLEIYPSHDDLSHFLHAWPSATCSKRDLIATNSLNLDCMYKKQCLEGEVSRDAGWRWGRCDGFKQAFKIHQPNSEHLGDCTVRKHHYCLQESRCSSMINAIYDTPSRVCRR